VTIGLQHLYLLCGLLFAWSAWHRLGAGDRGPRRWASATFWALLALVFVAGDALPAAVIGALAIALALLAGLGLGAGGDRAGERPAAARAADARRLGHRLFLPALAIPAVTVLGVLGLKHVRIGGVPLLDPAQVTLTSLGLACVVALLAACALTAPVGRAGSWRAALGQPAQAMTEGARLVNTIGWALLLPLMLATLGSVFAQAGVGEAMATLVRNLVPVDSRLAVVMAYTGGMAAFTMIMGNAFAAFPVITAGIGLPLLILGHGADPAPTVAIGMLSGYCGTLMTPMAANFNLVPAALLELPDRYGVIRAQAMTGLVLLAVNTALIHVLAFRHLP
jgi:uncharacterized membrane protein